MEVTMSQAFAEAVIWVPSALTTGYLLFVATVLQGVMNDLDEATFARFLPLLYRRATRSVYAISSSTIAFIAMIPYFIVYRFHHCWFVAGLVFFTLSSVAGKVLNLPVYARVAELGPDDAAALREQRRRLQTANIVRAALCLVSTVLMTIQFV
jgi:hypothetical protein